MATPSGDPDVIVIGGGIAGVAAALRLKDRGLQPLLLEAESRVGGRMTTDRVNGFVIDRGVTLLGNGMVRMRAMVRRLGLSSLVGKGSFSVGIQDAAGCRGYRGGRFEDLLFDRGFSMRARIASLRFGFDLLRNFRALPHGQSHRSSSIDNEDCQTYFRRIGGEELFERIFSPGLNGPMGGSVETSSRVILMQVIWNLLIRGQWTLSDGVDRIPETAASHVNVIHNARVLHVEKSAAGVQVEAEVNGKQQTLSNARRHFRHSRPARAPALPRTSPRFSRCPRANAVLKNCQRGGRAFETAQYSLRRLRFHTRRCPGRRNRNGASPRAKSLPCRHGHGRSISLGHSPAPSP